MTFRALRHGRYRPSCSSARRPIEGKKPCRSTRTLARRLVGMGRRRNGAPPALTLAEELWGGRPSPGEMFRPASLAEVVQRPCAPSTTRRRRGHYNLISALHKAVRGLRTPDAAFVLPRPACFDGGEDSRCFIAPPRGGAWAVEDIGAWPTPQGAGTRQRRQGTPTIFLGSPEGELAIANAVIYVATAPKSKRGLPGLQGPPCGSPRKNGSLMPAQGDPQTARPSS